MMGMFPMPYGETLYRQRRRLVMDEYSQEETLPDWSNPDELPLEGAAIAPSTSTKTRTVDRTIVQTSMSLYTAPGEDVRPEDRIRATSGIWQVKGEVANWTHPSTGWRPGAEFSVEKVEG